MPTPADQRGRGRWAGIAAVDRRAERRRLLLDAGFELLGTEGAAGTTVRAVCQHARLNPRYFYESFGDLDELVVAVYERVVDELRDALCLAMDDAPPDRPAQMRAAIGAGFAFLGIAISLGRARIVYAIALVFAAFIGVTAIRIARRKQLEDQAGSFASTPRTAGHAKEPSSRRAEPARHAATK